MRCRALLRLVELNRAIIISSSSPDVLDWAIGEVKVIAGPKFRVTKGTADHVDDPTTVWDAAHEPPPFGVGVTAVEMVGCNHETAVYWLLVRRLLQEGWEFKGDGWFALSV